MDTPAHTATSPDGEGTSPADSEALTGGANGSALPVSSTDATASRRASRKAGGSAESAPPSPPAAATSGPGSDDEGQEHDVPGWWRNTALVPVIVQPDGAPSAHLEPGEAAYLPRDPGFPSLEPCEQPEPPPAQAPDAATPGQESAR